ncbi:hypothetical protein ACLM5J_06755 [Nocardioides sp. Bht2]|uniref:hypothetical protein n=1 Tax=Nocardioides sp. Bht2 TaxID=3392297 RepID=UPI0039B4B6DB
MALVMCPLCTDEEDVDLVKRLPDGRKRVVCRRCDYTWEHGEPETAVPPAVTSSALLRQRFPKPEDVEREARVRAERLKDQFLSDVRTQPDPKVALYWAKYQEIFGAAGLAHADPVDLKAFANDPTGVYSGIMTEFNKAWNANPERGADRVQQVVEYLLRGPDPSLENRLTDLIRGKFSFSMPGFKEALLTKVLAVVYPERFLTIVTYDQKAIMAKSVYGLALPRPDSVNWTIGRLIVWSNDLLNELTGDGFVDRPHTGEFLWWAKDQPWDL